MPKASNNMAQGSPSANMLPATSPGGSSGNRSRGGGERQMQIRGRGGESSTRRSPVILHAGSSSINASNTATGKVAKAPVRVPMRSPESTSSRTLVHKSSSASASARLFQGSRNLEIHGGQMVAAGGHHISVTINANSPPADGEGDFGNSVDEAQVFPRDEGNDSTPGPVSHARRSCEIYFLNMALKNRGSPLWIPEPNNNLCVPYRKRGVSIGDVGILLASGAFCFFFNICLPHDDPINQEGVPEGFIPIHPPLRAGHIQRHREFNPDSYLASESIEISHHLYGEPSTTGLTFESTAAEGAILTMPHGAYSEDLIIIHRFRRYVAQHVESWYRYVNGILGCEAKNGDIRLVTGCDKTNAWGMATFSNSSVHHHNQRERDAARLRFQRTGEGDGSMGKAYRWEFSGSSDTRTGPDLRDVEELRRAAAAAGPDPGYARDEMLRDVRPAGSEDDDATLYENQCLFVRTLNTNLRDDVWNELCEEIDSGMLDLYGGFSGLDIGAGRSPGLPQSVGGEGGGASGQGDGGLGGTSVTEPRNTLKAKVQTAVDIGPRLRFLSGDASIRYHPSNELNDVILNNISTEAAFDGTPLLAKAKMVITEDKVWIDALPLLATRISSANDLFALLTSREELVLEEDFIYFRPPMLKALENTAELKTGDIEDFIKEQYDTLPGLARRPEASGSAREPKRDDGDSWKIVMPPQPSGQMRMRTEREAGRLPMDAQGRLTPGPLSALEPHSTSEGKGKI